ncbi:hypothetical protein F5X97DRAFT_342122 [Nemania serpens]|nr:hypothetical protein F5X97DRAFT_342122 [Nemania serpens]
MSILQEILGALPYSTYFPPWSGCFRKQTKSTSSVSSRISTPVFISHCVDYAVVPFKEGERLRDVLTAYGMTVTWKEYPNGGYWINGPQGVDDLVAFLNSRGFDIWDA